MAKKRLWNWGAEIPAYLTTRWEDTKDLKEFIQEINSHGYLLDEEEDYDIAPLRLRRWSPTQTFDSAGDD